MIFVLQNYIWITLQSSNFSYWNQKNLKMNGKNPNSRRNTLARHFIEGFSPRSVATFSPLGKLAIPSGFYFQIELDVPSRFYQIEALISGRNRSFRIWNKNRNIQNHSTFSPRNAPTFSLRIEAGRRLRLNVDFALRTFHSRNFAPRSTSQKIRVSEKFIIFHKFFTKSLQIHKYFASWSMENMVQTPRIRSLNSLNSLKFVRES